jgi:ABC-type multidrug transport system fused ATPase/permease subunit
MVGVIGVCVSLLADFILLVVLAIGMFYVDPIMSIGTFLLFSLLAYFLYSSMHEKMRKLGEMQGGLSIESSQKIFEVISSYRELIVRNRRNYYSKLISNARLKLAEGNASISFMSTLSKYILEIALVVGAILLAYYQFTTNSAYRAIATITVFIAASSRITPAILRLQQGFLKMKSSFAGAEPTLDLILELDGVPSDNSPIEKFNKEHADFRPEILVSDLSFRYSGYRNVLENINLDVRAGEFVALVGGSGAGKTTLFDLMIGALEPSKGDVAISGQPPKTAFSKWPGAVAYVPQDIAIIDGSVRENLGLGFPQSEITDDDCWQSLKLVGLEDFVRKLPNSLDTQVGDRGTSLSGGQRQRLGIARALMTKPKLMFLDEATSALDGVTESEISESIRGLTGELTLVVIAHRLSTIKNADRIYLIEDGQIKGMGTFEVLKATYPKFLIQAQIMGL